MDAQKATFYSTVVMSYVIVCIIFIFFVISVIRHGRRNRELLRLNMLAEVTALEAERSRMSSDLHDDLGPLLSFIKFQIECADPRDVDSEQMLRKASSGIDEVIERVRSIAKNLMPPVLARKGIIAALEEFTSQVQTLNIIDLHFTYVPITRLDTDQSIHLYRIVQELIQNVIKHAEAKRVNLQLVQEPRQILLYCHDDGKGFDYEIFHSKGSGLGLRNIQSRVHILNGKLQVDSKPGKGSHFYIQLPL